MARETFFVRNDADHMKDFCFGWRPSLLGWRPSEVGWREAIATRLEAIASRLEGGHRK